MTIITPKKPRYVVVLSRLFRGSMDHHEFPYQWKL